MPILLSTAWKLMTSPLGRMLGAGVAIMILLAAVHHAGATSQARKDEPKLTACAQRADGLAVALKNQNDALDAKAALDAKTLDATTRQLAAGQDTVQRLQARSRATLAFKPTGADACARLDEIRRHYVESLK